MNKRVVVVVVDIAIAVCAFSNCFWNLLCDSVCGDDGGGGYTQTTAKNYLCFVLVREL